MNSRDVEFFLSTIGLWKMYKCHYIVHINLCEACVIALHLGST